MDNKPISIQPISIQNVTGNVTITQIIGDNNQTQVQTIGEFIDTTNRECGLKLIYEDNFKENSNTTSNFNEWLDGFTFNLRSIYYEREYRRKEIINSIKKKLEGKQRFLLLGESGTSKSTFLMEILCDYLKKGYKILHNLDPTASGVISNLDYLENTLSLLVKNGNNVIVIVDNVHTKTISTIFSLIQKIQNDHEDKLDKIRFLLSARQPEFGWAMDRGIFDVDTIERINRLFDDARRYNIPYFTTDEVKGFIEKYKEYIHPSKRNNTVEENALEIFEDTQGHPIMVRFSVLQDGLRTHVNRMYLDHLVQKDGENNSPNSERIKSVIACSLYDISSIPLTEEELYNKLDLKKPSLQIINTILKRTGNVWTTIHPRWDLELLKYMFSLNEADRVEIQELFGGVLTKILDVQRGSFNQLLFLNTLYNTIAAEKFIDIKIIQEMIKEDDIEKKIDDPYFKVVFFANFIGVAFAKLKNYQYAVICYDKAIKVKSHSIDDYINKGYTDAYNNKGVALYALGRKDEAIVSYDKAIEINPQYADAYNNKGVALSALGRKEEAIECYNNLIRINPQYADAHYNKGVALSDLDRKKDAIVSYDKAIEINPQYADAYISKGNTLAALGRKEAAIASYDKAIEINPQYALAYINKGRTLLDLDRKQEAIVSYDKAIEINPQYADAYISKGVALTALGKKQEAIKCYDKAIEIYPQYAIAHYNKGNALSDLGRKEEAIVSYDKAIEINSQYADAYINKGLDLSALGRKEAAIASYDKAIEINSQDVLAYITKGNALSDLGRDKEAIECYDKSLAIDPNDNDAINGKAFALAKLDKNEEALPIIQKVLESDSNNEYYLSTAAFIMYNLERYDESKIYYNKALNINSNLKDTLSDSELKAFNSVME